MGRNTKLFCWALLAGGSFYVLDKVIYPNSGARGSVRDFIPEHYSTNQPFDDEVEYALTTLKKEKVSIHQTLNLVE